MRWLDLLGFVAAAAVLAGFCMNSIRHLRMVALASNILFVLYGLFAHIYPSLFSISSWYLSICRSFIGSSLKPIQRSPCDDTAEAMELDDSRFRPDITRGHGMLKLGIVTAAAVLFSALAHPHYYHFVPRATEPLPPVNVP